MSRDRKKIENTFTWEEFKDLSRLERLEKLSTSRKEENDGEKK